MKSGILYGSAKAQKKNGAVTVCEWSDFRSFIETDSVPAFVFWGNTGCGYCDTYIKNVIKASAFTQFIAGDGSEFAYYQSESDSDVKQFVQGPNGKYPFARLYWKKTSGQIVSKDISRGTTTYATKPETLISDITQTFSGYQPKAVYTLTYQANGGSGTTPSPVTAEAGTSVTLSSSKLTKTGWTHVGWQIDGATYGFGASYTLNSSVTASAAWARKDTDPDTPSEPKKKDYDIPTFDPAAEHIPDRGQVIPAAVSDFPLYHTYKSDGTKYIRMSDNISALCVRGQLQNGMQSQLKAAYINKRIPRISPSCFMNCSELTAVNADNSVNTVDDYAFYGCSSLRGVSFLGPDNKQLKRIGDYAFAKSGLESIKINLVGSVDDSAMHSHCFASCDSLEQVEFTNSTYLGDHQFDGCKKLSRVILNNYHSYVSEYCFANCASLASISLPAKTYMISPHMFDGCANLTSVGFASNADLRQLGDAAFGRCPKLTSIILPESVSSLSFIDPNFLSGSSISRVEFMGIDDDYLTDTAKISKEIKYEVGKIYETDIKNLLACADENNVPVVAWLTKGKGYGCGRCDKLQDNVITPLTQWFGTTKYLYAAGKYAEHSSEYSALESFMKSKGLSVPGTWAYMYLYWAKEDGTVQKWTSESISPGTSYQDTLKNKIAELFAGYDGQTEITHKIKESITTFGRGEGLSVTYVSKTGNEYICGNDTVEFVPETKVDRATVDDFRYGIWYYNARQLKEYADQHSLPVLFEYSSTACDPCRDFRKSTFMNQTFQAEVKKRPSLFCRVEIGEGEYFDHPSTTQAYYLSHTLNKENTYIPCLIYYWKKADGSVTQTAWNYNYRTDPANSNWETVLSKLDGMLGGYSGESQYWPPAIAWSDNGKFQYYANETLDDTGRYFVCDEKKQVSKYVGTLEIDIEHGGQPTDGWYHPEMPMQPSAGQTLTEIEVSMAVSIPNYTYQYYTTSASDAQYNTKGVIFKVSGGVVQYIFEFSNVNDQIPGAGQDGSAYTKGNSYKVESATGFQQILDTCQSQSIPLVVLESGTAETGFDSIIAGTDFKKWLRNSAYIMVEVRQDDWASAVGQAVRQFETSTAFHGNSTSDPLPKLLAYHGCSSCTADGRLVTYCRRKIAVVAGKDYKYYTDLLDTYANEYEE